MIFRAIYPSHFKLQPCCELILLFAVLFLFLTGCSSFSDPSEKKKTSAGLNVQLGLAYIQQDQMERAKQKLLYALKQAPDWPPALDAMAFYLEKTGETKEAQVYYERSLALAPNEGSVQNNYGAFLCRMGRLKEAEKHFLQATQDKSSLAIADAYENAGLCALKIPDKKKAVFYFKKALLHSPGRAKTLLELKHLSHESV